MNFLRWTVIAAEKLHRQGYAYKKTEIMLTGIALVGVQRASLLAQHGIGGKSEWLMKTVDELNQVYGMNLNKRQKCLIEFMSGA